MIYFYVYRIQNKGNYIMQKNHATFPNKNSFIKKLEVLAWYYIHKRA